MREIKESNEPATAAFKVRGVLSEYIYIDAPCCSTKKKSTDGELGNHKELPVREGHACSICRGKNGPVLCGALERIGRFESSMALKLTSRRFPARKCSRACSCNVHAAVFCLCMFCKQHHVGTERTALDTRVLLGGDTLANEDCGF